MGDSGSGPRFLILGGVGFIGRNLVEYLVTNKFASFIRVADKSLPAASYFSEKHKAIFDNKELVQYKQADLAKDDHIKRAFEGEFDFVINLCGETRFGLSEGDYKQRCLEPAKKCAAAAAKMKIQKYVEVSSGQVYKPGKQSAQEGDELEPWTLQANYRLQAEEVVRSTQGLPWVVLRPATVYGEGDLTGITPRITCAAVYTVSKEKMKFLWDESLIMDVVHVADVCQAIWEACIHAKPGSIYNVAEPHHMTQGELSNYLGAIFKIETGFHGGMLSKLAPLASVAEMANDKHVPLWTQMCQQHKILNTPLSPYIDKELLHKNSLNLDGTKISKETEFKYTRRISIDLVREQVIAFQKQGLFPPIQIQ